MAIEVRLFANLREQFGFTQLSIPATVATVGEVWMAIANGPPPDNLLCAVNHAYASLEQAVHDRDEVAFFPPVSGG